MPPSRPTPVVVPPVTTAPEAIANGTTGLPSLPQPIRWLITGAVRHAVVGFGVWLFANHILVSTSQQTAFDNWGTDTVLVIAGLGWSFLNQKSKTSPTA